nr:hypothetical protein [Bacteroidales bacterium]
LTVSGVYRSYLIGNLMDVDERPSALFYGEYDSPLSWMPHIIFKAEPGSVKEIETALKAAIQDKDININYYADKMLLAYDESRKMHNTLMLGSIFSMLIAIMGLVGFIRDESIRRSKEMAIRKINGASSSEILGSFAADIIKISILMSVLASICAYYDAGRWLENFAEKTPLSLYFFILGSLLVLLIVMAVVSISSMQILRANPVDSLKNE